MGLIRGHDVEFQVQDGPHKGERYGFTLATQDQRKVWRVYNEQRKPPSMIKERVELAVTARDDNVRASGDREQRRAAHIVQQMSVLNGQNTQIRLRGYDGLVYWVLLDEDGPQQESVVHEAGRDPEFRMHVRLWGYYT